MDLQNILQDERKKKFLIIGLVVFFVVIGSILIFSRSSAPATGTGSGDGQTQLLTDLSQLAPRDGVAQDQNRLIAPIVKVSADVPVVAPGQPSVISWNASNATSCVDGNGNAIRTSGSLSITPQENYTMDVVCTNPKGTTIESITVAVTTTPIITLTASPEEVLKGEQSFISWTTVNTTRCTDSAGKTLRLSGGMPVAPQTPYTFEINCTGPNGTAKKLVTVGITTIKVEDKYVWVFTSKATATSPSKTSTFQTSEGCQSAYDNSTAYQKSNCVKVAVGKTTGGTTGSSGGDTGGLEILTCLTITQNLKQGSTDATTEGEVTVLQKFLVRKGLLSASITGNFGPATESAVKAFQTSAGISASGTVDAATQAEIKKVSCKDAEDAAKKLADDLTGGNNSTTTNPGTEVVTPGAQINLELAPVGVGVDKESVLSWDVTDALACSSKGNKQFLFFDSSSGDFVVEPANTPRTDLPMKGSARVKLYIDEGTGKPSLNTTFEFACTSSAYPVKKKTITLSKMTSDKTDGPPVIHLTAAPPNVSARGQTSTVSWENENATECKLGATTEARATIEGTDFAPQLIYDKQVSVNPLYGSAVVTPGTSNSAIPAGAAANTNTCDPDAGFCNNYVPEDTSPSIVTLSCKGPLGTGSKTITVSIVPPPSSGGGGW